MDRKGKEWLAALSANEDAWYASTEKDYPVVIHPLYLRLRSFAEAGEVYGFFLQLRDLFESLIRWYVLIGFALAKQLRDTDTIAIICDPEHTPSFGDWVQEFPTALSKNTVIGGSPLGQILKKLKSSYNRSNIVSWRNEAIGHGALQPDTSQEFLDTLEVKLRALNQCLTDLAPLAKTIDCTLTEDGAVFCRLDGGPQFPLAPFIRNEAGDYRLFDCYLRYNGMCKELSYLTGRRTSIRLPYFHELALRYHGDRTIDTTGDFDDTVFTGKLETALQHFHETGRYWKQPHYKDWLTACLERHPRGIFLLRSDSGTGKSVFTHFLDGHGKKGLEKQGVTCRAYHFSRLAFQTVQEFAYTIQDLFRSVPENEDDLRGRLPVLNSDVPPDARGKEMAEFLRQFQALYQKYYHRDKLLLVLDGIDECRPEETGLLHFVPNEDELPDGVYLLLTCCSDTLDHTFQQDFLNGFRFTDQKSFIRTEENRLLLRKAILESVFLSGKALDETQADKLGAILDQRFTGLPVIRAVLEDADTFEDSLCTASLLEAYVSLLKNLYGAAHFHQALSVLLTLALAVEPLNIRLLSQLAFDRPPCGELLAIMRDLTPLLTTAGRGTQPLYLLGHPDFSAQLRGMYPDVCRELVLDWQTRIAGRPEDLVLDRDVSTYIASGMYTWEMDILGHMPPDQPLLENMLYIAETFSQQRSTVMHLSKTIRILLDAKNGLVSHWEQSRNTGAAALAIHALAVVIPKLLLLEDTASCLRADAESERLVSQLPDGHLDDEALVPALFFNYTNRMTLMSQLGDNAKREAYREAAWALIERHPEWIPNIHQIPFIHNAAIDLKHRDPAAAAAVCDHILAFPESRDFDRARALLVKAEALKIMGRQEEAGDCIRQAVAISEHAVPVTRVDAATYPNALQHLGGHLCHIEGDFHGAIEVLEKALSILDRSFKANQQGDRFAAARLLSEIGGAYYGMDATAGNTEHREACLNYMTQSVEVYRLALREHIGFQPASAEAAYTNAAYAYHYYGLHEQAIALLRELEEMQLEDAMGSVVVDR